MQLNSTLIFLLLSFIFSIELTAQVIIKEKVEINPQQNILPEYPASNFDPCLNVHRPPYYQSVYSCSIYPVEPFQQNFPWQSGSYMGQFDSTSIYNIEIIYGTEFAYLYKAAHWDSVLQDMTEPEYYGSSLTGLTGSELSGTGEYEVFQWVGIYERKHPSYYEIRFDNFAELEANVIVRITNLNTSIVTEWHTTIVNPQYTMQNLGIDGDTLLHKRVLTITPSIRNSLALTCNQLGYGSCPPTDVTFNIEIIEGEQYGSIGRYDSYFGAYEYSSSFNGLSFDEFAYETYVFNANGLQPDSTAVVKIRQSSSDADIGSIDYTFYVKRNFLPPVSENGSIVIETNKNTAMPGDTLDVLLRWEDGSNGIVDFADWQEFAVWVADGFDYGTILNPATSDTSDSFEIIGKEFKLLVSQNITDANAKIVIAAETEVAMLGGATRMQSKNQDHLARKEIKVYRTAKIQDKEDKESGRPTIDLVIGSQYLSGIKEIIINPFIVEIDPPVISAGDTARIIPKYMDSTGNYVEFDSLQTFELGMLDGCLHGKLSNAGIDTNYFYGVNQPFYFIADTSADSGSVNIRVGVIESNQQNRYLSKNNSNIENDNPVDYCFLNLYQTSPYINANVVVGDVVCDTIRPLLIEDIKNDVITKVTTNMFSVSVSTDNGNECSEDNSDQGGWASTENYPSHYVAKAKNAYYYLTELNFNMSWGLCSDEINDVFDFPQFVDVQVGRITGITNVFDAQDAIDVFETSTAGGFTGEEDINYYPLPKTINHELKHISQYKDSLKYYYDKALEQINWMKAPPLDYCDPAKLSLIFEDREKKFKDLLTQASIDFGNSHKIYKEKYESEADKVGNEYVHEVLIPLLEEYIENPY